MAKTPETKAEKKPDIKAELIGNLHPPVLSRRVTEQKFDYLAKEVRSGNFSLPAAIHKIHRYTAPLDEKFIEPIHHRLDSP